MLTRTVAAIVLLVAFGGLFWWASSAPSSDGPVVGEFAVSVVGPEGERFANGTVHAVGTPYEVLRALAAERGFAVEVEEQPWIGPGCTAVYVKGIGPWSESATGGWNYYVRAAGGDWTWRPEGAACLALQPGQSVKWCWVEGDRCGHHEANAKDEAEDGNGGLAREG